MITGRNDIDDKVIDPEQISHFKKIFWYKGDGGGAEPVEEYQPMACGSIEGYTS